jgi:hypothetical protein
MAIPQEIVRLKITLDNVKPVVMRRIEVPLSISLDGLHELIQAIMPWENSHMYDFYLRMIDGPRWLPPSPFDYDFGVPSRDSTRTTLAAVLAEPNFKMLRYNYDFGDDWRHTIKVERRFSAELWDEYPRLIDAKGRCPPENCGGPWGYAEYLDATSDPTHRRHSELKERFGDFDPKVIDRAAIEAALHQSTSPPQPAKADRRRKRASKQ